MAASVQNAKQAAQVAQKVNETNSKMGLDVDADPPMCHAIINIVVAFLIAPLAHYFARPGDFSSKSFQLSAGAWVLSFVLYFIPLVGGLLSTLCWLIAFPWTTYVCVVSEKNRKPKDQVADSGALALERV